VFRTWSLPLPLPCCPFPFPAPLPPLAPLPLALAYLLPAPPPPLAGRSRCCMFPVRRSPLLSVVRSRRPACLRCPLPHPRLPVSACASSVQVRVVGCGLWVVWVVSPGPYLVTKNK
jgi:hypothetical protein